MERKKAGKRWSKSSSSGTSSLETKSTTHWSVKDLCAIIRAASQYQVKELSLGNLRLVFASRLPYEKLDKPRNHSVPEDPTVETVFPSEVTPSQVAGDFELSEEV